MEPETASEIAAVVFIDIAIIVAVARLLGQLLRRYRQPAVVAEIAAGLILGPSLVGALPGDPTSFLFPDAVRPYLAVIASLGLVIFMFIVGLELDLGLLKGQGRIATGISLSSIVLPFGLGLALAVWLYSEHSTVDGREVEFLPFALFIAAAMSVTAFPILARILAERRMHHTRTGVLALAAAAVDDVVAWTMLAGVLAVANASSPRDLAVMVTESIAFVLVAFLVVRPRLRILVKRREAAGRLTPDLFAVVLIGILVSSFITDEIGIHAIFGAFLFGAIMPRHGAERLSTEILERVEQVTVLMLLPVFFIVTGLNVDVTALGDRGFLDLAAVLVVACTGKFVGASLGARMFGVPGRRAAAIGVLMNTRGLTELVILNVGVQIGVLDQELFTVLVLMALITTVITAPLLGVLYPARMVDRDIAAAERAALGAEAGYRVLVAADGTDDERSIEAAVALVAGEPRGELVVVRFEPPFSALEVGSGLTAELAAVADSFEATDALARIARDRGVRTVIRSRFSSDRPRDLEAELAVSPVDVVVLARDSPLCGSVLHQPEWVAVLVEPSSGEPTITFAASTLVEPEAVVVAAGSGPDGLVAVEQGLRVAAGLGVPLSLIGEGRQRRRAEGLVRRIDGHVDGVVSVTTWSEVRPEHLVLIGAEDLPKMAAPQRVTLTRAPVVLVVSAPVDDHGQRLDALLGVGRSGAEVAEPDLSSST